MDRGGLLHEFFTLAIQEISALPIFVGTNPVSRDLSLDATGTFDLYKVARVLNKSINESIIPKRQPYPLNTKNTKGWLSLM